MKSLIKKILILLLGITILSSCWAPRCPIRTCFVRYEHKHAEIDGTFGGKQAIPSRMHYTWDHEHENGGSGKNKFR